MLGAFYENETKKPYLNVFHIFIEFHAHHFAFILVKVKYHSSIECAHRLNFEMCKYGNDTNQTVLKNKKNLNIFVNKKMNFEMKTTNMKQTNVRLSCTNLEGKKIPKSIEERRKATITIIISKAGGHPEHLGTRAFKEEKINVNE